MNIEDFEATLPREAFRETKVVGKSYRVYGHILDVNKLGKVRVVVCYDSQNQIGEAVYLATDRLYWEEVRVILAYSLRFRIDTFYKDAKYKIADGGSLALA